MGLHIYASGTTTVEVLTVDSKKVQSGLYHIGSVYADGDELKRALQITGLPQYGSVMSFFGDTAKHIVGNWFN